MFEILNIQKHSRIFAVICAGTPTGICNICPGHEHVIPVKLANEVMVIFCRLVGLVGKETIKDVALKILLVALNP